LTEERTISLLAVVGRMKPGIGWAAARADMERVAGMLTRAYPADNPKEGVLLLGLQEAITGDRRGVLMALWRRRVWCC